MLSAIYYKTPKNTPAGKVFDDLGFSEKKNDSNKLLYEFEFTREIPCDGLITIEYEGERWEL